MKKSILTRFTRLAIGFIVTMVLSAVANADTLRFWTTEEQPDRLAKQQAMAADFKAKTGIEVEVIPVTEKVDENYLSRTRQL